jgi:hypothetical protein
MAPKKDKENGDGGKVKKDKSKKEKMISSDDAANKGGGGDKDSKKNSKKKNRDEKSDSSDDKKKKKGDSKKKKKKKKSLEEEDVEEDQLLEVPPDQGFLGNMLERYCCCRSAAKVAFEHRQREERERKAVAEEEAKKEEEKAKEVVKGDIPIRELRKHIRNFTKEYEATFWPPFWTSLVDTRVQKAAATRIQTLIRTFLGPVQRRRREMTAFVKYDEFWQLKRKQKLQNKDLQQIAVKTRATFSSSYARNVFNQVVSRKAKYDAVSLLQRAWRGYVGRSISSYFRMLARELRVAKEVPPKSRFSSEIFKRVWGRKRYKPEGGWPGRADFKLVSNVYFALMSLCYVVYITLIVLRYNKIS